MDIPLDDEQSEPIIVAQQNSVQNAEVIEEHDEAESDNSSDSEASRGFILQVGDAKAASLDEEDWSMPRAGIVADSQIVGVLDEIAFEDEDVEDSDEEKGTCQQENQGQSEPLAGENCHIGQAIAGNPAAGQGGLRTLPEEGHFDIRKTLKEYVISYKPEECALRQLVADERRTAHDNHQLHEPFIKARQCKNYITELAYAFDVEGMKAYHFTYSNHLVQTQNIKALPASQRPALFLHLFRTFLPCEFFQDVLIPRTNQMCRRHTRDGVWKDIDLEELLAFFCCYFGMAALPAIEGGRRSYWDYESAPSVIGFEGRLDMESASGISYSRFKMIESHLTFWTVQAEEKGLQASDDLYFIREMQNAFNQNMVKSFSPGWSNVLDETISLLYKENITTVPFAVFVPRKCRKKCGHEIRNIACAQSCVIWQAEIFEGGARPPKMFEREYEAAAGRTGGHGRLGAQIMRLCQPIQHTERVVFLDSLFSVTDSLCALRQQFGLHWFCVVKNRATGFPAQELLQRTETLENGQCAAIRIGFKRRRPVENEQRDRRVRTAQAREDTDCYYGVALKDSSVTFKAMATGGSLLTDDSCKRVFRGSRLSNASFARPKMYEEYYQARHAIDSNNHVRAGSNYGLDEVWSTKNWRTRLFAWFIGVAEANVQKFARWRFGPNLVIRGRPAEFRQMRLQMVQEVFQARKRVNANISNNVAGAVTTADSHDVAGSEDWRASATKNSMRHFLLRIPDGMTYDAKIDKLVPYLNSDGTPKCSATKTCAVCRTRGSRTAHYCACRGPAFMMHQKCFAQHVNDCNT